MFSQILLLSLLFISPLSKLAAQLVVLLAEVRIIIAYIYCILILLQLSGPMYFLDSLLAA